MSELKTIVVAEDDNELVILIKHALKRNPIHARVHFLPNGVSLMRYLSGHQEFSDRAFYALPDLIVLDLKMPFFDALQTLPSLKVDAATANIPVYIFTDEHDPSRIAAAYKAGASAYFIKPSTPESLREVLFLMGTRDPDQFSKSPCYRPRPAEAGAHNLVS